MKINTNTATATTSTAAKLTPSGAPHLKPSLAGGGGGAGGGSGSSSSTASSSRSSSTSAKTAAVAAAATEAATSPPLPPLPSSFVPLKKLANPPPTAPNGTPSANTLGRPATRSTPPPPLPLKNGSQRGDYHTYPHAPPSHFNSLDYREPHGVHASTLDRRDPSVSPHYLQTFDSLNGYGTGGGGAGGVGAPYRRTHSKSQIYGRHNFDNMATLSLSQAHMAYHSSSSSGTLNHEGSNLYSQGHYQAAHPPAHHQQQHYNHHNHHSLKSSKHNNHAKSHGGSGGGKHKVASQGKGSVAHKSSSKGSLKKAHGKQQQQQPHAQRYSHTSSSSSDSVKFDNNYY